MYVTNFIKIHITQTLSVTSCNNALFWTVVSSATSYFQDTCHRFETLFPVAKKVTAFRGEIFRVTYLLWADMYVRFKLKQFCHFWEYVQEDKQILCCCWEDLHALWRSFWCGGEVALLPAGAFSSLHKHISVWPGWNFWKSLNCMCSVKAFSEHRAKFSLEISLAVSVVSSLTPFQLPCTPVPGPQNSRAYLLPGWAFFSTCCHCVCGGPLPD